MIDYEQYEDNELIALLREKNLTSNKAFNLLYKRYYQRLYKYCLFKTDKREDAQDLIQDIWMKFLVAVSDGIKINNLSAYLYGIAKNCYAMKIRDKNSNIRISEEACDINEMILPYELNASLENKELVALIKAATNNLSVKNKDIFIMKWFTGLAIKEIAEILNDSTDNIKQRSSRSMKEVMTIIKPIIDELNQKK